MLKHVSIIRLKVKNLNFLKLSIRYSYNWFNGKFYNTHMVYVYIDHCIYIYGGGSTALN